MIALAIEALAASTALMLLVLALRGSVRRAFGAELAYLLWLLPVLRLVLPPLPSGWSPLGAAPIASVGEQAAVLMAPIAPVDTIAAAVPAAHSGGVAAWFALLWGAGALAILTVHLVQYARFRARVLGGAAAIARVGSVEVVESAGASGPLAFGLIRRIVAFPRDFAERYDADERELALAHEIGHHRRGDLWANWVALGMLALHWFNPVAWIAFRAFRADQEMANDAGVLARAGAAQRHAYGCAIVKAAHGRALTPACHLNTVNDLKGRLRMLARTRVSGRRVAAGGAGLALVAGAGLVVTASGMPAAARVRVGVEQVTGVRLDELDRTFAEVMAPITQARSTRQVSHATHKVTIVEDGRTTVLTGDEAAAYAAAHPVPLTPVPPTPPIPPVPGSPAQPPQPPAVPLPPSVPTAVSISRAACADSATLVARSASGHQVVVCDTGSEGYASNVRREALAASRDAQREALEARREGLRARIEAQREAAQARAEAQQEATQARIEAQRDAAEARVEAMRETRSSLHSALSSLATTRASLAADPALTGSDRTRALRQVDQALANVKAQLASAD
ncbi:Signal transducer regulating beta-lactamase production, contains metallopeptidase domain [Sphingomonas palmae]|uniref:Signal transducer regulating beta-lactamase production, contains metallopeptidase domain n=1 Tax=Sphingomonas palmae TaxID=1855283 RepID=A0A1H7Q0A3_9SPHN|nr:M56 family metallopeptidase [Sphingomonas palmae]SEL41442.1 Signal transducer regulating beta-lactamase production, contains metallopeptidase domain [Sphingomonas palmae]